MYRQPVIQIYSNFRRTDGDVEAISQLTTVNPTQMYLPLCKTVSQLNPESTPLASISVTIPSPSECLSCRLVLPQQPLCLFHPRRKDISGCNYSIIKFNETGDYVIELLIALILSFGGQDRRSARLNYISLYIVT